MGKKFLGLILAMVMVVSMLTACGSESTNQSSDTAADTQAIPAATDGASTGEVTEITWLHHFQEAGIQKWAGEMITRFEAANPDIKVNVEVVTQDVYDQTLKTKIASDDAPMIFDLANKAYYKEYGEAGHLYERSAMEGLASIDPTMLPAGQVDGKQWGVPLDVNGFAVFYNKAVFDKYNLTVPSTLSELKAVCDTLVENGVQPFAAPMSEQWCLQITYEVVAQAGDAFCGEEDWYTNKMNLTSNFSDDADFKKAVEIFCGFKPYWGEDPFGTNWDTAQNMLANGEAAMIVNGSWTIDGITAKNPDAVVRVFAMPTSEDPNGTFMNLKPGNGICLYNSQDEKKLEDGKKFHNFLLSKESGEFYAQNAFKMSTVAGVDFSFSNALMDIKSYSGEQIWNSANVTMFTSEYEQLFYETLVNYSMEDTLDVDALAKSLDEDFTAISN